MYEIKDLDEDVGNITILKINNQNGIVWDFHLQTKVKNL